MTVVLRLMQAGIVGVLVFALVFFVLWVVALSGDYPEL